MWAFLQAHSWIFVVMGYVLLAAINSLPDPSQKFEWYPWIYHTAKSLINAIPPQYKLKVSVSGNGNGNVQMSSTEKARTAGVGQ